MQISRWRGAHSEFTYLSNQSSLANGGDLSNEFHQFQKNFSAVGIGSV
jgi:hypothetical protein